MSALDPMVERHFGWLREVTFEQLMTDPVVGQRLAASYLVDPDYRRPDCVVEDVQVPTPDASSTVAVRVYTPHDTAPTRALTWAHGGGWSAGDLDGQEADGVAREIATRAGALVVSVGYRLADGQGVFYPQLHREVAAAFTWTRTRASHLGIDPSSVQLGGASAGANLALSATLEALAEGTPLPGGLQLVYPLVHRTLPPADTSHLAEVPDVMRLRQPIVDLLIANYLGPNPDAPYFELGDTDPALLPPTLIVLSEYDELRSSGEDLARRIQAAGGQVTTLLAEGTIHGHLTLSATAPETDRSLAAMADFLRR